MPHKIPVSVLVVVHARELRVLLIERAESPGYWQSVTGSREAGESLAATARRELREETGIEAGDYGDVVDWRTSNVYEIYARWRHRYAPGTTHNTEHVFGLELPAPVEVRLDPREHRASLWLPWDEAAAKCFSWSNRDAILRLPERAAARGKPAAG